MPWKPARAGAARVSLRVIAYLDAEGESRVVRMGRSLAGCAGSLEGFLEGEVFLVGLRPNNRRILRDGRSGLLGGGGGGGVLVS